MSNQNFDFVIVGGGMVGASLACLLARANRHWSVALIEKHSLNGDGEAHYQPSFDARSTALARGSIELLQQMGIWPVLQQHTTRIDSVHISDRGHFGGAEIQSSDYSGSTAAAEGVGAVVENSWLGSVLLQQLALHENLSCLAPAVVKSLRPKQQGYQLVIEQQGQESALSTSLCVICDGAQSKLRAGVGIDSETVDYQQHAIIANVELSQPHSGVAYERFTDSGPMALLPLGESADARRAALVWTLPSVEAEQIADFNDDDFLQRLQQRFGFRLGHFLKVGQRHSYPLQLITATEQVRSHLVLMGNAAHFLHPVAGQGFNLALRDCAALVDSVIQAQAQGESLGSLPSLQTYLQQQSFDQTATIGFSHAITKLFSSAALPQTVLRALGFMGLEFLPPAKQALAEQTMGTFGSGAALK